MRKLIFFILIIATAKTASAQTDIDGLMMEKGFFCVGPTAGKSSWKKYWEGTFKRENLNLGRVSTTHAMIMGNYGVTKKINVLFGLPYIKTKPSAGNLSDQKGLQDLSLFIKWQAYTKRIAKGDFKTILIGGYSFPVSNYLIDQLPLSIGLHSKNSLLRLMLDYQHGNLFATASGTYIYRSNVHLDRNTYYTTEPHYTNEVKMPDASDFNFRIGYRSTTWIAEAILDKWTTLGGFDITKNNMPFVSNKMNATTLGLHVKYETSFINGLSIVADGVTTISGRNVGQSTGYSGGVFYIMDFGKKEKKKKTDKKTQTK